MAATHLLTGGARSGKSTYALNTAEHVAESRCYIATCPVHDEEMRERVRRHQAERAARNWVTLEEHLDLAAGLRRARAYGVVLVDCLTLWVSNLMAYYNDHCDKDFDEDAARAVVSEVMTAANEHTGHIIFVTNEVGMGIVPDNALARRYRDVAGACNQAVARACDRVTFMVSGYPLSIKAP